LNILNAELFIFVLLPLAVALWYWLKTSRAFGMPLGRQLWGTLWRTWVYGFVLIVLLSILARVLQVARLIHFIDLSSAPISLLLGVIVAVCTAFIARYAAGNCKVHIAQQQTSHLGGAVVAGAAAQQKANDEQWRSHQANRKENEYIQNVMLAGLWCPLESEARHFKIMGTTGSGKSVAIRSLLSFVQQRAPHTGDRVVIADPDGGYLSRFYDPERGDVILNPFDARTAHWALFRELRNPYDADQFAASLVPDLGGDNSVWAGYARTLVSSTIQVLLASGDATTRDLYDAISIMNNAELGELLSSTSASRFFENGAEETLGSIRTNASQALRGLSYLSRDDAFSINEWIRSGRGWLFIPYKADQIAALKPVITTWMRTAIFSTLSLNEGDSRLWFVIDELDALGKIDGLSDALTRLRKFGGRVVLGFQSIGPLETIYGKGYGASITENAGNTLILRCSSSDGGGTSRFASYLVGKRKVKRLMQSSTESSGNSSGGRHSGNSSGYSEQITEEDAVMASEIEQLPDMSGYLKFATLPMWNQVNFVYDDLPLKATAFESEQRMYS
jgi:type IV secretory pathway TraG/TraD family ATPase VirD4